MRFQLALLALFAFSPTSAKPSELKLANSLTLYDDAAVCNDGTPQQFYWKAATEARLATTYLIYLSGGGWCWNTTSCQERVTSTPWQTSSHNWPATMKVGGLFDDDPYRSPLAGANMVYVGSCTSDAYVGDISASSLTGGLSFRGSRAVPSVITALQRQHGLGEMGVAQKVVLAGCASGGRGVLFNLDFMQSFLPPSVEVHGFADAALWLDIEPFTTDATPTLQEQTKEAMVFFNASGRLGPLCLKMYGDDAAGNFSHAPWKCLYPAYRMQSIRMPLFLSNAQFDSFSLPAFEGGKVAPYRNASLAYAVEFGTAMNAYIAGYPRGSQPMGAVFSPACYRGCSCESAAFYTLPIYPPPGLEASSDSPASALSLAQAVHMWLWDGAAPMRVVEQCAKPGFACGVCRNRTQPLHAAYVDYRRAHRPPPAPHSPPAPSRLDRITGFGPKSTRLNILFMALATAAGCSCLLLGCARAGAVERSRAAAVAAAEMHAERVGLMRGASLLATALETEGEGEELEGTEENYLRLLALVRGEKGGRAQGRPRSAMGVTRDYGSTTRR